MAIATGGLSSIGEPEIEAFREDGFLVVDGVLDQADVVRIRDRFESLFDGDFETGVYPDEWYWRTGMSLPDVTRHMANLWKSDLTIASLVVSAEIGRIATMLAGWPGARLGQDTLWMKPPEGKEVSLHQDASFVDFLDPPEMLTCWFALDDTRLDGGTIEYVPGSHRWELMGLPRDFHVPDEGYQSKMRQAAARAGVDDPTVVPVAVSAGSCIFHHGRTWHGSAGNVHADTVRRSIAAHTLSSETRFPEEGAGYIYGRYKRIGDTTMAEDFFPILWTRDGYRSPHLADYCGEMISQSQS
jgi:phytanoyl-CoA hydroxylase